LRIAQLAELALQAEIATTLHADHERLETVLDRLREIADGLDCGGAASAATLIFEADQIVARRIVERARG
jgi:hypothetical protein